MSGCNDSIEEDRAVVWNRDPASLTDHEWDLLYAALSLDGPEMCAVHRREWEAIAEGHRRPWRILRAQAEVEAAIAAKDPERVVAAIRARRALQEAQP